MVSVRKRGKVYQYQFDVAPIDGKRKTKSGCATKKAALEEGIKAYNEYNQAGHKFEPNTMSEL